MTEYMIDHGNDIPFYMVQRYLNNPFTVPLPAERPMIVMTDGFRHFVTYYQDEIKYNTAFFEIVPVLAKTIQEKIEWLRENLPSGSGYGRHSHIEQPDPEEPVFHVSNSYEDDTGYELASFTVVYEWYSHSQKPLYQGFNHLDNPIWRYNDDGDEYDDYDYVKSDIEDTYRELGEQ